MYEIRKESDSGHTNKIYMQAYNTISCSYFPNCSSMDKFSNGVPAIGNWVSYCIPNWE